MDTRALHRIDQSSRAAIDELRRTLRGDVRDDRLNRALYATDASIYQIVPDGVVLPKTVDDMRAAVRICAGHGVPITARGAGTGLAGGAVNRGIQLDCSRYLNRIIRMDPGARTALVEAGVVLDELNAAAATHGLHFAPDVATSSRATLGGMIANNSCGAHSIMYGRTVDHVLALQVVLSDGSEAWWGHAPNGRDAVANQADSALARRCEEALVAVFRDHANEIKRRYPNVMRRNGGYALDRVRAENGRVNVETVICGSEGTLAVVAGALLKLTPLPKCKGLVVSHFDDLLDALAATPAALEHGPAAVELLDKLILDAARSSASMARKIELIEKRAKAVLIIELFDDEPGALGRRLDGLAADLRSRGLGFAWPVVTEPARQADVWSVRKAGLGLLMSRPGQRQPYDFVDDTAVDPSMLREFIGRFMQVLREEGVEEASYYAHASVGCLHVKPVLNLRKLGDVQRMYRVADRISSLALEFGGTMTGEHGDGLVRSVWLEKMFGPKLIGAFRRVKTAFDPHNIFNPGKIVDPLPMTDNLRWRPRQTREREGAPGGAASVPQSMSDATGLEDPLSAAHATVLDFSRHGGMVGLAEMCSGVGQCRTKAVGTMCPSYMATGDELHTTRARANALRMALNDRSLLDGLSDPALDEVMDLCLSCKACKTECPTGVDMARLKAEWLHHRNVRRGTPLLSRLVAQLPHFASVGSRLAPVANRLTQSVVGRVIAEKLVGIDRRIPIPRLARQSFRATYVDRATLAPRKKSDAAVGPNAAGTPAGGKRCEEPARRKAVVLFVDTWTDYFRPEAGTAALRVLEWLGYEVIVPDTTCCGRPAISKGMLHEAKRLAERNATALADHAADGIPIVGLEPSCVSALMDELPQLVRSDLARRIAESAMMIETFLARHIEIGPDGRPTFRGAMDGRRLFPNSDQKQPSMLYHGHCHQKALVGTADAMSVLTAIAHVKEIDSGCCGMAGSFGHEKEHYEVARAIGEQRLFPAIRARGDAVIAVSGFSCLHQIAHHAGVEPRHIVEYLAEALPKPSVVPNRKFRGTD